MSRATWRPFVHPAGLLVLTLSALLAVAFEAFAPWSGRAGWAIAWGALAYGATVIIAALPRHAAPSTKTNALPTDAVRTVAGTGPPDLIPFTEEALRRLNDLAALATCSLVGRIPHTLSERHSDDEAGASTPLELARILRVVMVDAIEHLKPASAAGVFPAEAEVLRYAILHEEYVLGRPNHQIMARHNVSESTFHRYRRVGTRALADELARRERLLSQDPRRA